MANLAFAESTKQIELNTSIKDVTVYLKGAQITRHGNTVLKEGRSTLTVKALSPHIEEKSIQVRGIGDFTILSVNHTYNFLNDLSIDHKVDSLMEVTKDLEEKITINKSRISVLMEKQSLLNANKKLGNESASISIEELERAVDFYDKALMDIKNEEHRLKTKNIELTVLLQKIRHELMDYQNYEGEPTGEINIQVDAEENTNASFTIDYIVANAGWFPKYDLRVKDVESPLALTYKAVVYQRTGVDWNNVKLRFSNTNPSQSGVAPKLSTWYLNYERNMVYKTTNTVHYSDQEMGAISTVKGRVISEDGPLPGVNVIVKGTTVGTVTDVEGNYSLTLPNDASSLVFSSVGFTNQEIAITNSQLDVSMVNDVLALEEIVVVGYGASGRSRTSPNHQSAYKKPEEAKTIRTTKVENQTTVEFTVEIPYTLKSKGENLTVDLKKHEIETLYEYYAVPKLDKDAFLIARIINWDQFDLLDGEANLYFEDTYVGRSVLDAKALVDTLDISMGRDKNIIIGREKVETFTKRTSLGSNKVETRGFNIIARNKKSQSINLTIFDQVPVSAISPVEVSIKEISKGKLDEKSGEISWKLDLEPQTQTDLKMVYEVKYPKREQVVLE